jgi:hypothetical protein
MSSRAIVSSMIPSDDDHPISLRSLFEHLESSNLAGRRQSLADCHQIPPERVDELLAEIRALPDDMQYALCLIDFFSTNELDERLGNEKSEAVYDVARTADEALANAPSLILLRREEGIEAKNVADEIEFEEMSREIRDYDPRDDYTAADPFGELSAGSDGE